MIEVVCGTRLCEAEFWGSSPLGVSLSRLVVEPRLLPKIVYANRRGLPEIYNARIAAADAGEILLFVHDDIWIEDYYLGDRVIAGLREFDVIGVAGNRRRLPRQPAWAFSDLTFAWDEAANLSGAVAHGNGPLGEVSHYGPAPAECELLDGVLLAARRATLRERDAMFDPRFAFHFYDLDFCRTARSRGLRLGTWPICLTHHSGGAFGTEEWALAYRKYLEKWRD